MLTHAIVRRPGERFAAGLTTSREAPPGHAVMCSQHDAYVDALRGAGLEVTVLDPLTGFPDAHFVEDAAVVLGDVAVVTRPGAPTRRGEADALEPVLAGFRPTVRIEAPGTLDGGDVLLVGRRAFIGLTARTNRAGAEQLGGVLAARGYEWTTVAVPAGLHLKSSVNAVSDDTVLIVDGFPVAAFAGLRLLRVAASEAYAANSLRVNDVLLTPRGYPGVRRLLDGLEVEVRELEMSGARAMDGGLTCMSLRF